MDAAATASTAPRKAAFGFAWRRRSALGPILLYLLAAMVPLYPFRSTRLTTHAEIGWIVAGIVEARSALAQGQFPVRVADHQQAGPRYPIFQFYGALPFNAGAVLAAATGDHVSPYTIWKIEMWLALATGGWFIFLMVRRLTRHRGAGVWAGMIFLTAPYVFTDLRARGAVCETLAMCFMPAALYATLRCWQSRRMRYIPAAAAAWAAVGLSHNITYLYGAVFGVLFMLPFAARGLLAVARRPRRWRRVGGRMLRVAAAGALHVMVMAWYLVPPLIVGQELAISSGQSAQSPLWTHFLTPLPVLLAPVLTTPPTSTTPLLGLQVGWPILAGFCIALVGLAWPFRRFPSRLAAGMLLLLFAIAFLLVWSPTSAHGAGEGDIMQRVWAWLPTPFYYVQWTYRLLIFVVVFGAMLAGVALAWLFPQRRGGIGMLKSVVIGLLLTLHAWTYINDCPTFGTDGLAQLMAEPQIGIQSDYLIDTQVAARTSFVSEEDNFAEPQWGLVNGGVIRTGVEARLPLVEGVTALTLDGVIPPDAPGPVLVTLAARGSQDVRGWYVPGPFHLRIPVYPPAAAPPTDGATPLDADARPAAAPEPQSLETRIMAAAYPQGTAPEGARIIVTRLAWEAPPTPDALPRLAVYPASMSSRSDGRISYGLNLDRPMRVELPAVYYPHLLRVRLDGKPIAYRNAGRHVAVAVPPGQHRLDVRFIGVAWANRVSAVGYAVLATLIALPPICRRLRRRRTARIA